MKKKKTFDMLNGSIWNKLILFALPLAASSILQQLFNAADVAVVGSFAWKWGISCRWSKWANH